jgi:ribosomal protein L40E
MKSEASGALIGAELVCSKCQAINAPGARLCVECSAVLKGARRATARGESTEAGREAGAALRRAYRWIGAVTWLYRVGGALYAVATVFAFAALARTQVPLGPGLLVVALTTSLSVLMITAAIHILFRPFVWTVCIAVLATTVTVVHLLGPNPFGVAGYASLAWAVVAWAALLPTLRFRRLIAEHTDLYILHHASRRTVRSLDGHFARERHARLLAAMAHAYRRAWKLSAAAVGVLCLTSVIGSALVVTQLRPQEFAPTVAAFEAAWNGDGLTAATEFIGARTRARQREWLEGATAGHGWESDLPKLPPGTTHESEGRTFVDYELDALTLSTSWFLDGQVWVLIEIELPPPPFEPTLERFLGAWRSSSAEAVAGFFSAESRPGMLASIDRAARDRGWQRFPEVLEVERDAEADGAEGGVHVTLRLAESELKTEWHVRADGTWGLNGLRFPRR